MSLQYKINVCVSLCVCEYICLFVIRQQNNQNQNNERTKGIIYLKKKKEQKNAKNDDGTQAMIV